MQRWATQSASRIFVAAVLVVTGVLVWPQAVGAANLAQLTVRLDRMKASTATGGTICIKATTAGTEGRFVVAFPSTYTLVATASNWTTDTTNTGWPAGATAWVGISTATAVDNTAKTVTFPSGDLVVGTLYCFNFAGVNTLTTAVTPADSEQGSLETQTSGNAVIDYGEYALTTIADDQIVVTAVVPPSFIFTLNGNTDAFTADLDPLAVVSTGGRTVTVTTNAKGGWIAWVKDSQQGLYSPTATYTLNTTGTVNGTAEAINAGTEGYILDTDITTNASGGCTPVAEAEYNGTTSLPTSATGGTFSGSFQPIVTCSGPAPATANGDVITLTERATISGATPAASDYSDIVTVVGAGNF